MKSFAVRSIFPSKLKIQHTIYKGEKNPYDCQNARMKWNEIVKYSFATLCMLPQFNKDIPCD